MTLDDYAAKDYSQREAERLKLMDHLALNLRQGSVYFIVEFESTSEDSRVRQEVADAVGGMRENFTYSRRAMHNKLGIVAQDCDDQLADALATELQARLDIISPRPEVLYCGPFKKVPR